MIDRPKKILLVDDKPENLHMLDSLLSVNGFLVEKAVNGKQALEFAHKNPPDMIVADVLMPVMDGFELCHKIKTDKILNETAFIFYTASYLDKRDEELALSLGVDRYLLKPQEPDVLLRVFNEVFEEYASGEHANIIPFPLEKDYLRSHNESLIRMLEKKIDQLDKTHLGLLNEISIRKKAEEQLKASILEKDILIKEVYHRTKNNMQVIVGLFDLQARKRGDQSLEAILSEMSNRIYSMSMVHDLLYRSKNLYELKLDVYLESLLNHLLLLYETEKIELKLNLSVESIPINIQHAVPLGMVINEIISNSLKYAFPDLSQGEITVEAKRNDQNGISLKIGDNGIGLSDEFNPLKGETLGMHIIRMVIENQLFGEIIIENDAGLVYTLILPDLLLDR